MTATDEYAVDARYASNAADGKSTTFWSSIKWSGASDYKWLQVDLGDTRAIGRWAVKHATGNATTKSYKLQASREARPAPGSTSISSCAIRHS
nr:discoidin domain-containing protein [Cohnella hashimotonis]